MMTRLVHCSIRPTHRVLNQLSKAAAVFLWVILSIACKGEPPVTKAQKSADNKPIMIAVTPYHDREFLERNTSWVKSVLTEHTKRPVELVVTTSYDATIGLILGGQVSMASLSPNAYVVAKQRQPKLLLLARELVGGAKTYRSLIITKEDSPIKTLADLKGQKFCFVEPASASGYVYPRVMLRQAGVDPDKDLGAVLFTGSHPAAVRAVREGQCVAGAIGSTTLKSWKGDPQEPSSHLKLRTVASSSPIPGDAIVMRHDLPPALEKLLRSGFDKLIEQTAKQMQPKGLKSGGYMLARDGDYNAVRDMSRRSGPGAMP